MYSVGDSVWTCTSDELLELFYTNREFILSYINPIIIRSIEFGRYAQIYLYVVHHAISYLQFFQKISSVDTI